MAGTAHTLWTAYRLRWKRRRLLWRAFQKRGELTLVVDRIPDIAPGAALCFSVVRNEAIRLPFFLDHHRRLGVGHFLFVDNGSDDDTANLLRVQRDVSLWSTRASYKASRFGMDWLTWLMICHGHRKWCLTLDADELFVYPQWDSVPLPRLTAWLERHGKPGLGALMLDLYPKGPLGTQSYQAGQDPTKVLNWFDAAPYSATRQQPMNNLWVQGGARARAFFASDPRRAPTLNKLPLIKWNRRWVYVNSTHSLLPRHLNELYDGPGGVRASGVLLHTKFLPTVVERSREEKARGEHFSNGALYDDYYDAIAAGPDLWHPESLPYSGWQSLEDSGLMSRGDWS